MPSNAAGPNKNERAQPVYTGGYVGSDVAEGRSAKRESIVAAYRRDVSEGRKVYDPAEVPPFYEAITPEWLTAILCTEVAGSAVIGLSRDEVDDGTCNRRRLFVEYNQMGIADGLPRTNFCKAAQGLANRLLLSASATISEVGFYQRFRSLLSLDAPLAYHAAYDKESWAAIVMLHDMACDVEF